MAVRVDKAVGVHEAIILRLVVRGGARGQGLRHEIIDLLAALAAQADQYLHRLAGITDGLRSELPEFPVGQQHNGDRLADDDTSS